MAKRMQPPSIDGKFIRALLATHIDPVKWVDSNIKAHKGKILDFEFESSKSKPTIASIKSVKNLLRDGLQTNPTNVWNKTTIKDGFRILNMAHDNKMVIHGGATVLDEEACRLQLLWQELTCKKRAMGSGIRMEPWLKELVDMVQLPKASPIKSEPGSSSLVAVSPTKRTASMDLVALSNHDVAMESKFQSPQPKKKSLIRQLSRVSSDTSVTSQSSVETKFYQAEAQDFHSAC